jgi:hypothetical protein
MCLLTEQGALVDHPLPLQQMVSILAKLMLLDGMKSFWMGCHVLFKILQGKGAFLS